MEALSRHNSSLIGCKIQAKLENDCILRSGHRFKITQPNLMILVSFSSAEDALSNDVKKYDIFSSQGTENLAFRFFGDTRYRKNEQMIVNYLKKTLQTCMRNARIPNFMPMIY